MIENYRQLVPRYLVSNKKTTLSLTISILISVALLVSVGIVMGKYNTTRLEIAQEGHGKYYAGFLYVQEDTLDKLKKFDGISEVGTSITIGEVQLDGEKLQIKGADPVALNLLNAKAIDGRLPQSGYEVAIEKWMYNKMKNKPKLGDKFKFSECYVDSNGKALSKNNTEFTLVGILEDFQDSKMFETGNAYITLDTANSLLGNSKKVYEQWFTINNNLPVDSTLNKIKTYANTGSSGESIIEGYRPNIFYTAALNEAKAVKYITLFFNLIVAVAVVMVIYNVFSISVLQRKKHYGLLRAIGITPKQIKIMLFFEAFLYEVIVVPLGILTGILVTSSIMKAIGGEVFKGSVFNNISALNIILPILVSLIAITAAVYSPAKNASKISAIESMTMEDSMPTKKLYKAYKENFIDKLIGYTGKMAISNLKRYKRRFLATVIAIGMGISLFVLSIFIINFLNPTKFLEDRVKTDYVLTLSGVTNDNYGYDEEIVNQIKSIPGVKSVDKFKKFQMDYILPIDSMTPEAIKEVQEKKNPISVVQMWGGYHVVSQFYGCSDEFIQSLRKSVNESNAQVFTVQNLANENFTKIKSGDEVRIFTQYMVSGKFVNVDKNIKVDYVLKDLPMKLNQLNGYIATFVPYKFMEDNFKLYGYQDIEINVDHKANLSRIEEQLQFIAANHKNGQLISYQDEVNKYHNYQLQVGTILISLAAVIAVVGFINIMNTLNMNIIMRKREFGMLRAMGMTKSELRKVLLKEASIYGIFSSIIGITLGYILIWMIYNLARRRVEIYFYVDLKVVILTIIVTVILSICSSILPLRKATKADIVESIQAVE
ncbi:ABC transporter permease [Candidatus Clostridium radicumherbarum]|uniref:ABC transporter permease n=1 Tax=Candidatus Clostridium radicumherbarum TaxID=3381662 RepID=A0ABW8TR29_9CLOT